MDELFEGMRDEQLGVVLSDLYLLVSYVCMYVVCMYVCMYDMHRSLVTFYQNYLLVLLLYINFILNTFSIKKLTFYILGFCLIPFYSLRNYRKIEKKKSFVIHPPL